MMCKFFENKKYSVGTFLCILWVLFISSEYWVFGEYSFFRIHDNADAMFPARVVASNALNANGGVYPFWRPAVASGVDGLSASYAGWWTIDFHIFRIFSPWEAYVVTMALQRFFAVFFTFLLCFDVLKLSFSASLLGGIFWSMNNWSNIDWMLSYRLGEPGIPLVLWAFDRIARKPISYSVPLTVVLGVFMSWILSFSHSTLFVLAGVVLWFIYIRDLRSKKDLSLIALLTVSSFTFNLPEIWALYLAAPLSSRGDVIPQNWGDFKTASFSIIQSTLLWFTGRGLVPLGIGSLALLMGGLRSTLAKRILYLSLFLGIAPLFFRVINPIISPYIGFLRGFGMERFLIFSLFSPSVFAAAAIDYLVKNPQKSWTIGIVRFNQLRRVLNPGILLVVVGIFIAILFSLGIKYHFLKRLPTDSYSVTFRNPDIAKLRAETLNDPPFRTAMIGAANVSRKVGSGLEIPPAALQVYGFETFDGYQSIYTRRYRDFWAKVVEKIGEFNPEIKRRTQEAALWIYLYHPLFSGFEKTPVEVDQFYNLNLLSLDGVKYIFSKYELSHPMLDKLNDASEQFKEFEKSQKQTPYQILKNSWKKNIPHKPVHIYLNKGAFPRVFTSTSVREFDHESDLLAAMGSASLEELRKNVFLEKSNIDLDLAPNKGGDLSAQLFQSKPDEFSIKARGNSAGIVVMTYNFYPYWKCMVDQIETDIFPVYHTFIGIRVESGQHEIKCSYLPPYKKALSL